MAVCCASIGSAAMAALDLAQQLGCIVTKADRRNHATVLGRIAQSSAQFVGRSNSTISS